MVSRILVFFLFFFPKFSLFALDDSVKIFNTSKNKAIVVFLDKITSKKKTSVYDIPYYVTDNKKVKKIYNWEPKKSFLDIMNDVYRWMNLNKIVLKVFMSVNI